MEDVKETSNQEKNLVNSKEPGSFKKKLSRIGHALGRFFTHFKKYPLSQKLTYLFFPLTLIYLEVVLRIINSQRSFDFINVFVTIVISFAMGFLFSMLCSITKHKNANGWIGFGIVTFLCVYFALESCLESEFDVYMWFDSIGTAGGDVLTEAMSTVIAVIGDSWFAILLCLIPLVVYLSLFKGFKKLNFMRLKALGYIQTGIIIAILALASFLTLFLNVDYNEKLAEQYDYDEATRSFSLMLSTDMNLVYSIFGNPYQAQFDLSDSEEVVLDDDVEYNVTTIDLDELTEGITNGNITDLTEYIDSLIPSEKNEYTGLFEGMNLIQITAESFTQYAIDEELTPVLYMMATEGMIFEDYYQPLWSGSTTTGEYQILTSLLPTYAANSIQRTRDNNMYFTIGNSLLREGYTSIAFHDGSYTYYNRYLTHPNLGYTAFYANGNGMTGLSNTESSWPQSDLEMMEWIVPRYIEDADEPFNYYIMTVSGHSKYDTTNWISNKNMDVVEEWMEENDLEYTLAAKCYLANNLELEYAMEYLLEALEENDLLDNTVIVLTGDHYPYSLSDDYGYNALGKLTYYNVEDNLTSLYGFLPETDLEYNSNVLIIWTPSLSELDEQIVVSDPVSSLDILPTLLNLFGCEFDSRLLAGRDVFADNTQPLVIFSNYSWLTEVGYYDASDGSFTLSEGYDYTDEEIEEYVDKIKTIVQNKKAMSQMILDYDYYDILYGDGDDDEDD